MSLTARVRLPACIALILAVSLPLGAQDRQGVMGDLIRVVARAETKIIGLAKTMPVESYGWRPGKGVRSMGEVLGHIAADNYFMPVLMGMAAPAATGINIEGGHKTVEAFEQRTMTRDQIIEELEKSFEFLKQAMVDTPDATLEDQAKFSQRKFTNRELWVVTTAHLHEHLGQLIAYARSNNVTPPWSK